MSPVMHTKRGPIPRRRGARRGRANTTDYVEITVFQQFTTRLCYRKEQGI